MKAEPSIDKTELVRTLQRAYGISVEDLRFFPTGWFAYCYVVECVGGERRFLKLHSRSSRSSFVASSLDFYLPLTHALHASGILPHISHPNATYDERLSTRFGAYLLIMHDSPEKRGYLFQLHADVVEWRKHL